MTFGLNILNKNKDIDVQNTKINVKEKFKQELIQFSEFHKLEYDQYFISDVLFDGKVVSNINTTNGDLIHNIYLILKLPSIHLENTKMEFRWIDYIGCRIIDYIELFIDGKSIQKLNGNYIELYHNINSEDKNLSCMLGYNFPLLNSFSNKKDEYTLHIPIPFYFSNEITNSLPILRLTESNINISIKFNKLLDVIEYGPTHYFTISENSCNLQKYDTIYQNGKKIGTFFYFDEKKQHIHYLPFLSSSLFQNNDSFLQNIRNFTLGKENCILYNIKKNWINIPTSEMFVNRIFDYNFDNIFTLASHLIIEYIKLSEREKNIILNMKEIIYNVIQVHTYKFYDINKNKEIFDLYNKNDIIDIIFYVEEETQKKKINSVLESSLLLNDQYYIYEKQKSNFTTKLTWHELYANSKINGTQKTNNYIHMYPFYLYPDIKDRQSNGYLPMKNFHRLKLELIFKENENKLIYNTKNILYIFIHSYRKLIY